jgi:hypothetical protein
MSPAEYTAQAREKRPDGLSRPVQQVAGKSGPGFWRWACPGPSGHSSRRKAATCPFFDGAKAEKEAPAYENALSPVRARPMASWWTSAVPS